MENYSNNKKLKLKSSQGSELPDSDQLSEPLLLLVFESMKWDIHTLCHVASSCRKLHAIARRILWRELCVYRAPKMVALLASDGSQGRIGGGWQPLAKMLFFCSGCEPTQHFPLSRPNPGHFTNESRFSKTSGRSFLSKKCKGDLLYVSDPCEHPRESDYVDDLGMYRGIFREFIKSRTRACLVARQVALEDKVKCAYCKARVWNMTSAKLVPKTAAKRLGSRDDKLEVFVCVNGHLFGTCWLIPLSSDEAETDGDDEKDFRSDSDDAMANGFRFEDPMARNGKS